MTVAVYAEPSKPRADDWARAVAFGCGGKVIKDGRRDLAASDHVLFGNWPVATALISEFKRDGTDFWYCDSAYIQKAGVRALRIERGRFWPGAMRGNHTMERAQSFGAEIQPWRCDGGYVLICLHGEKFGTPWGIDIRTWNAEIVGRVREWTDRPIVVRRKPINPEQIRLAPPLDEQIAGAWALVTHSSTVAVKAVLAGVPAFVEPTSPAALVACTDLSRIETPVRPARAEWIAALAWRQWTIDEFKNGKAWPYVTDEFESGEAWDVM